jgi:hypothetical protein
MSNASPLHSYRGLNKTMAPAPFAIKRAHPRFKLFADAEAMLRDGTSIPGQLTELSAGGCYIHTLEPIAIGTPFELRIKGGVRSCELRGKAIYMHSGSGFGVFGVGVRFESMAADQRSSLEDWLRELGPTFHPASGRCDVPKCLNPASYRAIWMRSRNSQVVCENHKNEIDGKPFSDVADSFY